MNDKPIKCWYCARLGKCQKRKPCKAFRRYPYPTVGAPEREYTLPKVAELCGVHFDTLAKKLRRETDAALAFIYEKTGLRLKRLAVGKKHILVKEAKA